MKSFVITGTLLLLAVGITACSDGPGGGDFGPDVGVDAGNDIIDPDSGHTVDVPPDIRPDSAQPDAVVDGGQDLPVDHGKDESDVDHDGYDDSVDPEDTFDATDESSGDADVVTQASFLPAPTGFAAASGICVSRQHRMLFSFGPARFETTAAGSGIKLYPAGYLHAGK